MSKGPLAQLDKASQRIDTWALILADALTGGGRLLTVGESGSVILAERMTSFFLPRYSAETLYTDFELGRRVRLYARPGDVLIAISARPPEAAGVIVDAIHAARSRQMTALAFTGPEPNAIAHAATDAISARNSHGVTIQDVHRAGVDRLCAALAALVMASNPQLV